MKSIAHALTFILLMAAQPSCQASPDALSEEYVRQIYDWEITVNAKKLDCFLAFPTSKIAPAYDLTASYQNFTPDHEVVSAPITHRQYLCGASKVLGCKTFNSLSFAPGTQGAIRFCNQSGGSLNCPWAISSVIARLILDLNLRRVMVDRIILPAGTVDSVASDLSRYGFYTFPQQPGSRVVSHILITLVADSGESERTMYYNGF